MTVTAGKISNKKDILIDIGVRIQDMKKGINQAKAQINSLSKQMNTELRMSKKAFMPGIHQAEKDMAGIRTEMNKLAFTQKGLRRERWTKSQIDQYQRLQDAYQKTSIHANKLRLEQKMSMEGVRNKLNPQIAHLNQQLVGQQAALGGAQDSYKKTNFQIQRMGNELTRTKKQFPGWALSIMFFGMAMQRVFTSLWKTGSKTFNEVMHSVEGTSTGFDKLEGSMKYLGFTIGSALEPLAGLFIPFIDGIRELIDENEDLFRIITLVSGILGSTFMVGGMVYLGLNGIIDLFGKIGIEASALKSTIARGFGVIAIYWALESAADAFKSLSEGDTVTGILQGMSSLAKGVGGMRLAMGAKGGMPLLLVGIGLEWISEGKFWQNIYSVFGTISGIVVGTLSAITHELKERMGLATKYKSAGEAYQKTFSKTKEEMVEVSKELDRGLNFMLGKTPDPYNRNKAEQDARVDRALQQFQIDRAKESEKGQIMVSQMTVNIDGDRTSSEEILNQIQSAISD